MEKLKVSRGILIIDGVEWFLFCRKYKKGEALFKSEDDEVLIIDDSILEFEKRELKSRGANNLQNNRK